MAVAVGVSYTEYYLNSAHQQMTAYTATSGTLSVVCGRLSFTLGLKVTGTAHAFTTQYIAVQPVQAAAPEGRQPSACLWTLCMLMHTHQVC